MRLDQLFCGTVGRIRRQVGMFSPSSVIKAIELTTALLIKEIERPAGVSWLVVLSREDSVDKVSTGLADRWHEESKDPIDHHYNGALQVECFSDCFPDD